jgi:hypothetical protein
MPGDSPGLERFDGRCEPGVSAKRRISGGFGRGNGSSVHPAPGRAGRALRSDEGGRTDSRLQAAHALRLDGLFAKMYAEHERVGRPSIAPEKPAAAGDAVWVPTVFRKNRERLPYRLPGWSRVSASITYAVVMTEPLSQTSTAHFVASSRQLHVPSTYREKRKTAAQGDRLEWLDFTRKRGRGDRIRTCDLYVPNVALYQTELHPD